MLSLLLDENLSPEIAVQITRKRPDMSIISIFTWQEGRFLSQPDEIILRAAAAENLTLVTYDQRTLLPLLALWGEQSINHAGVIFVEYLTAPPHDFGTLVRSLIALWDRNHDARWTNAVIYLFFTFNCYCFSCVSMCMIA